jgi:hypothetical protein
VCGPQKQNAKWNLESSVPRAREQVVRLEDPRASCLIGRRAGDHDDGIKGLLFKQLYSFLNHFDLQCSKRFNTGSFKLDFGSAILCKSQTRFQIFDSLSNQNDSKMDKYG